MYEQDLITLVKKIQNTKAEFQTVEVKRCQSGVTEKLYDTLSSFSNQDDGGVIVFGLYDYPPDTPQKFTMLSNKTD